MDKIKAFFSSVPVKIVSWVVLALAVVSLIIGGATEVEIAKGVTLTVGICGAVALLIAFISSMIKTEKKEDLES